jgi:hypothetical protein
MEGSMNLLKSFAVLLVLAQPLFEASAGWVRTSNTAGNAIQSIVRSGGDLFAATFGTGIFRSSDNGATWTQINAILPGTDVRSLLAYPGFIFAGTNRGVVCTRSTDNGITWTESNSGFLTSTCINGLVMVVDSGRNNMFAATYEGVYRSTNNGATWTISRTVSGGVRAVGLVGKWVYSGGTEGVYRTTDLGGTWAKADSGMTSKYASAFTTIDSTLYATTFGGGIFKTTNRSVLWTAAGLTGANLWSLASTDTTLYAGDVSSGVWRSTNRGANWTSCTLSGLPITSLMANGAEAYAGTVSGLYHSTNSGTSWGPAALSSAFAGSLAGGTTLYAGGCVGVSASTDSGTTWTWSRLSDYRVLTVLTSGTHVFAGSRGGGVFFTTNGGTTWAQRNTGLTNQSVTALAITPASSAGINLFAGTEGSGVYFSADSGRNWVSARNGLTSYNITSFAVLGSSVLTGTSTKGVFVSTDNGANWTQATASTASIMSLAVSGTKVFGGTQGGGVVVSSDTGKSWTPAGLGTADIRALAVSGPKLFAGTGTGVWLTTDNGSRWSQLNTGLADSNVYSLGVIGTNLFAGVGSGGVWKRPLSELVAGVSAASRETPITFELLQNYPNPFNPTTVIRYQLPVASVVRLVVCDLLGREVAVLVDGKKEPGSYDVKFDGSRLSSGVYFYRLHAGDFMHTRKLTFLK